MVLGTSVPETIVLPTEDYRPNLYPYNAAEKQIVHEQAVFDGFYCSLPYSPGDIAKWTFAWDNVNEKVNIFVDGVYNIETDIPFIVYGFEVVHGYDKGVLYWEDDTTFYIKNYNLLLSTPKQPLYDALNALEEAPIIKIDDTILGFENPPVTESDRTLVPMRFLFEQLGAEVEWDAETETATATNINRAVTFAINDTTATVNGSAATMDVPARLIGDKTYVPLRFLSEELGYTVKWDEDTRMATVITK